MPFRSPLRRKNFKQNATQSVVRAKRRSLRFEALETRRLMTATRFANTTTVKAVNTNWFDTNIHDNNLKNLAKADFQDGVLNRADMIGLFRKIEQLGAVTSTQLTDLKAIVNNSSLFGTLGYVQVFQAISCWETPPTAHYQGATLGNLAAGFTSAKLENLVQKWFFGADHPVGKSDWGPTYSYRQVSGQLFVEWRVVHRRATGWPRRLLLPGFARRIGAEKFQRDHQHVHRQRRWHLHRAIHARQ